MSMRETSCPCCGEGKVEEFDICPVCGWENDPNQEKVSSLRGANHMTLEEAREAYRKGKRVE